MVRIKSSQKLFTEEEVVGLTGICSEHLRGLARNKHLGNLPNEAESDSGQLTFTHSDLMILTVLYPRCQH